jgi:membrane-bound lytic murein transglycosylase MltF
MRAAFALVLYALACCWCEAADTPRACTDLRSQITREARFRWGLDAPVPLAAGLLYQESSCNPSAKSADGGEGLGQLTGRANVEWISREAGLGAPDVWNAGWNMRASFWLLDWGAQRVAARDDCQRFGAALSAYNGGLGYVLESQRKSPEPATWWGVTEQIPTRQSSVNFAAARSYPHKIVFGHQPMFASWGRTLCL